MNRNEFYDDYIDELVDEAIEERADDAEALDQGGSWAGWFDDYSGDPLLDREPLFDDRMSNRVEPW